MHFQADFSRRFYAGESPSIQLLLDGRKSNAAQIVQGYISSIIDQYNSETLTMPTGATRNPVRILARNWFNPNLDYLWFTVPSLVVIITLQMSVNVTSMSIAREREMGTFDQLLVSPLGPLEIMAGKTIPAFLIALAQATLFILVAVFIFRIPFHGSLLLLYASLIVFISRDRWDRSLYLFDRNDAAAGPPGILFLSHARPIDVGLCQPDRKYARLAPAIYLR